MRRVESQARGLRMSGRARGEADPFGSAAMKHKDPGTHSGFPSKFANRLRKIESVPCRFLGSLSFRSSPSSSLDKRL
jgi:hypothetical protein